MSGSVAGTASVQTTTKRRFWLLIDAALVVLGVALLLVQGGRSSPSSPLTLANTTYQLSGTQMVVSVVFTNTTKQLLLRSANSTVRYLTPDGWQNHAINNLSNLYPLFVRLRQVISYRLYLPAETRSFQISTDFAAVSRVWPWLNSIAEKKWVHIPEPINVAANRRFNASIRPFSLSCPEITVAQSHDNSKNPLSQ